MSRAQLGKLRKEHRLTIMEEQKRRALILLLCFLCPAQTTSTKAIDDLLAETELFRDKPDNARFNIGASTVYDTRALQDTSTPDDTRALQDTSTLDDTRALQDTSTPDDTRALQDTSTSDDTRYLQDTSTPDDTRALQDTNTPDDTRALQDISTPDDTRALQDTSTPDDTRSLQDTSTPDDTRSLQDTSTPDGTRALQDTSTPDDTRALQDTSTPDDKRSLQDTSTPDDTRALQDTSTPYDTRSLQDTSTPDDKISLQDSTTPDDTRSLQDTSTSDDARFSQDTSTPDDTRALQDTSTPDDTRYLQDKSTPDDTRALQDTSTPDDTRSLQDSTIPKDTRSLQDTSTPDDTRSVQDTSTPDDTSALQDTSTPDDTSALQDTSTPDDTRALQDTSTPDDTRSLQDSTIPKDTRSLQDTSTPDDTRSLQDTSTPDDTRALQDTSTPDDTRSLQDSTIPKDTRSLQETSTPDDTRSLQDTSTPDDTSALQDTSTPDDTRYLQDTSTPDDTRALQDTSTPDDTRSLQDTSTPDDTRSLQDTSTLDDTSALQDTSTPDDTRSLQDTSTPDDTRALQDTSTPDDTRSLQDSTIPKDTRSLQETSTPDDTRSLQDTSTLDDTSALQDTSTPDDTSALQDTSTPDDTRYLQDTSTPDDTRALQDTSTPDDTLFLQDTSTPDNERSLQDSTTRNDTRSLQDTSTLEATSSTKIGTMQSTRRPGLNGCANCRVKGRTYEGHSRFQYDEGCLRYRCVCRCDGSWYCPPRHTQDICPGSIPTEGHHRQSISFGFVVSTTQVTSSSQFLLSSSRDKGDSCRSCVVNSKEFRGATYFTIIDGCVARESCFCYCNGSWVCPPEGTRNTCNAETSLSTQNGSSEAGNGKTSSGQCDGSCSSTLDEASEHNDVARRTSRPNPRQIFRGCRNCTAGGKIIKGNNYFDLIDGCMKMSYCTCFCNGTWRCPEQFVENICKDKNKYAETVNKLSCSDCKVYGSMFPGNQYFQVSHGCFEYSNCVCHCNGSWTCPEDSVRDVCNRQTLFALLSSDSDQSTSYHRCASCLVYGKYFKGGDYFDVIDGCMSYRKCICRCDGSWDCNNRFAKNICKNNLREATDNKSSETGIRNDKSITSTMGAASNQCSYCDVKNKVFTGNSYFELIDGCVKYESCLCRCDGSWECLPQTARNICPRSNKTATSDAHLFTMCSRCVAKGKIVRGNSDFELAVGCTLYSFCRCNCNGTWSCSEQQTRDLCAKDVAVGIGICSTCQTETGITIPPNSQFKLTEDCIEHTCHCFCNGSWSCPQNRSRWICQDRCLQCNVGGRSITNNTEFVQTAGCLEYTCTCHCNGTWTCPENKIKDACLTESGDDCHACHVTPTEVYDGGSDFVLEQDCLHYKCRCNCDGSYFCPGKDARNECRGEVLGGCRTCIVSGTEIYRGNTSFEMRRGCFVYNCKCNCDGSWQCPAEKSWDVCLGEAPRGCRVCRVSDSEIYRDKSYFILRQGCLIYRCKCNCDGSWSCLGKDARDTCKGEVPGGCRSCLISDTEFYSGTSNFEIVKNCVRYKCRCNCDGSYTCPGETAARTCDEGAVLVAPTCGSCSVSDREQFEGNSRFYLERDCSRYECECKCDGSWECPPDRTRHTCAEDRTAMMSSTRCKPCRISEEIYPGNSTFKFNNQCFQFDCSCSCSGQWSCDTNNFRNVCKEKKRAMIERSIISDGSTARTAPDINALPSLDILAQSSLSGTTLTEPDIRTGVANTRNKNANWDSVLNGTTGPNDTESWDVFDRKCRPCHVDGRKIQVKDEFSLSRGCMQYTLCRCYCNGRWRCDEVSNRCDDRSKETSTASDQSKPYSSALNTVLAVKKPTMSETKDITSAVYKTNDDVEKYVADEGVELENEEKLDNKFKYFREKGHNNAYKKLILPPDSCQECIVRGQTYPKRSKFVLRDGCLQRNCQCHCDSSWSCSNNLVDICKIVTRDETLASKVKCQNCRVGNDVYISEKYFLIDKYCLQHNCFCFCNGTYECPVDRVRNKCLPNAGVYELGNVTKTPNHSNQVRSLLLTKENGEVIGENKIPGCKDCNLDTKKVKTLSSFVKHVGCYEAVCFCQCNGSPACSPSAFVNVCKLFDQKSAGERKGCQVGQRTYVSRVFAHVENCIQRTCVCHHDGQWSCKRSVNDIRVC